MTFAVNTILVLGRNHIVQLCPKKHHFRIHRDMPRLARYILLHQFLIVSKSQNTLKANRRHTKYFIIWQLPFTNLQSSGHPDIFNWVLKFNILLSYYLSIEMVLFSLCINFTCYYTEFLSHSVYLKIICLNYLQAYNQIYSCFMLFANNGIFLPSTF